MNALLRLYPRAWRKRYGDEVEALLDEHPASLLDQLDLIRGALDARLHPVGVAGLLLGLTAFTGRGNAVVISPA